MVSWEMPISESFTCLTRCQVMVTCAVSVQRSCLGGGIWCCELVVPEACEVLPPTLPFPRLRSQISAQRFCLCLHTQIHKYPHKHKCGNTLSLPARSTWAPTCPDSKALCPWDLPLHSPSPRLSWNPPLFAGVHVISSLPRSCFLSFQPADSQTPCTPTWVTFTSHSGRFAQERP